MTRYIELVVSGDDRDLKGYLGGYLAASGPARIVYADEAGFHLHRLRERIKHHGEIQHVIVENEQAARVRKALAASGPRYQFEIRDERSVERGRFAFEFDTPSRKVADQLKQLVDHLPVGTVLTGYTPEEKASKDEGGAELYSPVHDYRFSGHGEIRGDLFAVVDARAAIAALDFTKCGEIEIDDPA